MIALFEKIENKKNEIQNIKKKELKSLRKELFDYIKEKYLPAFDMNLKYGYLFSKEKDVVIYISTKFIEIELGIYSDGYVYLEKELADVKELEETLILLKANEFTKEFLLSIGFNENE